MQQHSNSLHVIGILMMIFSVSMIPPMGVSLYYTDHTLTPFIISFFATISCGFILWKLFPSSKKDLTIRQGFLVVFLFWVTLSMFGALPFILALHTKISYTDAFFETVSALTTTGSTIFSKISTLPKDLLYYRQQMEIMGGMGVVVFAVAILPMLGVGGMQLFRAEVTGPDKTAKLSPKMSSTAKSLWGLYLAITIACFISFWSAGMPLFDAICESFTVVSTGGLTIHDNSFAFYKSDTINYIAMLFMLISSINFGLHYNFVINGKFKDYWRNSEFRMFFSILIVSTISIATCLYLTHHHTHFIQHLKDAAFTVIAVATTTGITTTDFSHWPIAIAYSLMVIAIIGGCSGSTSGGIKVVRLVVLAKQGLRELHQLLHPRAISVIKIDGRPLTERISNAIWAYLALFVLIFVALWIALLATGLDSTTAFGAIASCISNCGAGIGGVAQNYEHISIGSKWVLIFAMLTGRLEIFTVLVLFTRDFWRH
jgi:trk system potassium uptake protein